MGTFNEGDLITWEVLAKFEQTLLFRLYMQVARHREFSPDKYIGDFPMHAIELSVGDLIGTA